jgi:CheY-like chemotaxis protein
MPQELNSPCRILVVDDQHAIAWLIQRFLERRGFSSFAVSDSRQALQAVRDYKPHIAILDISMPHLDGYEVARQIRREPGFDRIPLVAYTTMQGANHLIEARLAGFTHHLPKPCNLESIELLIAGLVARATRVG